MKQRITNAKIVNEGSIIEGDLVIDGDRIEGIKPLPRMEKSSSTLRAVF
ncbi:MAG: hypothetical protein Ct9H90mP27_2310 [Gammaproteobacteria bacterium]|nr:MAG: hypothetical protein Ct9H90mP27_2310 [Gammaproteobacteria bacterium]